MARLASGGRLQLNPFDLERLGVTEGDVVRLTFSRGTIDYAAHATNVVPRGTALMALNQSSADPAVLIDASAPVTEIRVEVIS
jgi:NADH-quinone oxidoreductase subunit G